MINKKICLGMIILISALGISSCELFKELITVPEWAQGTWYLTPDSGILNVRLDKMVEITEKEFIPSGIADTFPLIKRTNITVSTGNVVQFEQISVKKRNSPDEIEVGFLAATITVYK